MTTDAAKLTVVNGGGLVGSLLALYLIKRHGCPAVHVYEKRSDIRKAGAEEGRSINLVMTSRGLYALSLVGLREAAVAISVPVQGRMMHPREADQKGVFQPYGLGPHEVNYSVSRTKLNALLIEAAEKAGCAFHFEHEVTSMDLGKAGTSAEAEGGRPKATYTTAAGATVTVEAAAFYGTDGAGSPTRQQIVKHLCRSGVAASDRVERLGISYKELTFPVGKDGYSMNKDALHIWPRGPHFLMGLADLEGSFTGTLYLPDGSKDLSHLPSAHPPPQFDDLKTEADYDAYVKREYPDLPALVPDCARQLASRRHGMLATLRATHWHAGGAAVVLGDAAHAVVPFFGQGMNLGMECVVVLDRMLTRFAGNTTAAFPAFEQWQQRNATAIADMAIENFKEMSFDVSQPEWLRRKAIESALEARLPAKLRSRYYMVTKTLVPYVTVKAAGPVIAETVDAVVALLEAKGKDADVSSLTDAELEAVIDQHFTPFATRHSLRVNDTAAQYYP